MTINRALRELTDEGLLVRLQGSGLCGGAKGQSALFEIRSIADEIAARNHQHHCEVLVLEETQASAEQAIELNVTEGTRIFHSVMVHYENDIPVQIEDRCVNAERIPDYLNQDYTQTTPHAYLSLVAPLTEGSISWKPCAPRRRNASCCVLKSTILPADPPSYPVVLANCVACEAAVPGNRYRLQGHFMS